METILIKKRPFEIVGQMGNRTFKGIFKGKNYFIRKFEPNSDELDDFVYIARRLSSCGVRIPELKFVDGKTGYIAMEFVEGPSVFEELCSHDLPETYYQKAFLTAWYAKGGGFILSPKPEHYKMVGDKLYYLAFVFHDFQDKDDFAKKGVRLWFLTPDFVKYAHENGVEIDPSRIQDEFKLNKEIVLMACKYYR